MTQKLPPAELEARAKAFSEQMRDLHRQLNNTAAREAIEFPLFEAALADPVLHFKASPYGRKAGDVNAFATAAKHGVNFKRFRYWLRDRAV